MARSWTHFTSYLSAGDILSAAMRNELIDQIFAIAGDVDADEWVSTYSSSANDVIRNSPIATDVFITSTSPLEFSSMSYEIFFLAGFYEHPDYSVDGSIWFFDNSTDYYDFTDHGDGDGGGGYEYHIYAEASDDLSINRSDAENIMEDVGYVEEGGQRMNDFRYWNLLRYAITQLDTPLDF